MREKIIVRTSVIGILANIFLAGLKAIVGMLSNSVAIILDAVNNLSDALSSVITIIGTKLASKEPDKKHPLGYGRIEYLSATVIAVIVLYAGVTSLFESVKKIITPVTVDYSRITLILLGVAVVVKIVLGIYVKHVGKCVESDALKASGNDALNDSIISFSTIVAAVIFMFFKLKVEAYLGVIIACIIIKAGYEMLMGTVSTILGERVDSEISEKVKSTINSFDKVRGTYDLVIHNYGPEKLIASAHIEVLDTLTMDELDELERDISRKVFAENHIIMTGISIYSYNTKNEEVAKLEKNIREKIVAIEDVLQIHGFFYDKKQNVVKFDVVIDYDSDNRKIVFKKVLETVENMYPNIEFQITEDADASE